MSNYKDFLKEQLKDPKFKAEYDKLESWYNINMIKRTIESVENRIAKLQTNPVENAKLIKKWQRLYRRLKAQ